MSANAPNLRIRALVVDDEEPGRRNLCLALQAYPHWTVVAEAASAMAAEQALLEHGEVDVVFLDIRMPQRSGLLLARDLVQRERAPWIVFVTAFNEHAVDAFELHALDYLLKPFSDRRLGQTVARIEHMLAQHQQPAYKLALRGFVQDQGATAPAAPAYWQQVSIRSVGKIESVKLAEVTRIEAQGNYAELHLADRRLLFRASMQQLEQHLDPAQFIRIHRGTIIRCEHIQTLVSTANGYLVRVRGGETLAVSERYVKAIKTLMCRA